MSKRLGRGLEALFADELIQMPDAQLTELELVKIEPNPNQPRKQFSEAQLLELAQSILLHGVVQPIVVRPSGRGYIIIAGERRYRAAKLAELTTIPAIVKDLDERDYMEVSLIENMQREDLNAVEEAMAMRFLMDEHNLTQEDLSTRLSKSRSAIANTLRLLSLPDDVLQLVRDGELSAGHARALVALPDSAQQSSLAKGIVRGGWSVRQTEQHVRDLQNSREKEPSQPTMQAPELYELQNKLREKLGLKVSIIGDIHSGRIVMDYKSRDALQGIYDWANE